MSDFDEEAERERLREQYERDQRKREATEKMSDLLLKGATMTNAHCQECGDPIFRYDGQEFCPTCERVVEDNADAAEGKAGDGDGTAPDQESAEDAGTSATGNADSDGDGDADADAASHIEVKSPDGSPATTGDAEGSGSGEGDGDDAPETPDPGDGVDPSGDSGVGSSGNDTVGSVGDDSLGSTAGDAGGQPPEPATPATRPDPNGGGGDPSLSAARESLVRTLTAQARRAGACEDPRQARDHLEAAREAAETLAALSS